MSKTYDSGYFAAKVSQRCGWELKGDMKVNNNLN